MAAPLNYATQYAQALANAFPYVLRFGALWASPNARRYQFVNAQTIRVPILRTSGRTDASRDTIGEKRRNYTNEWEDKTLAFHRKWNTLVHPADIDETNMVASIQNITRTMNETEKFPEMDKYVISKIYADWEDEGNSARATPLSSTNILQVFDEMMESMDEALVPDVGRILYVTPSVRTMINNAQQIQRTINMQDNRTQVTREISRIDEVGIERIPSRIMRTAFDFTTGAQAAPGSNQIQMALIHPESVLPAQQYAFARLDPPSAGSEGKFDYFEESYEDIFILNEKAGGIDFVVSA